MKQILQYANMNIQTMRHKKLQYQESSARGMQISALQHLSSHSTTIAISFESQVGPTMPTKQGKLSEY